MALVTIKNREIIQSFQLLGRFDELKGIKGSTKFRLAKIGLTLKSQFDLIMEARNKIAKEVFPEKKANPEKKTEAIPAGTIDQKDPQFGLFSKQVDEILDDESSLEIPLLKASDLNLDNNDVPFTVLMTLDWLIVQDSESEEQK